MKAKTIIYLIQQEPIRSPEGMTELIEKLDKVQTGGTVWLKRLTDHGTLKDCALPAPAIIRLEDAEPLKR